MQEDVIFAKDFYQRRINEDDKQDNRKKLGDAGIRMRKKDRRKNESSFRFNLVL